MCAWNPWCKVNNISKVELTFYATAKYVTFLLPLALHQPRETEKKTVHYFAPQYWLPSQLPLSVYNRRFTWTLVSKTVCKFPFVWGKYVEVGWVRPYSGNTPVTTPAVFWTTRKLVWKMCYYPVFLNNLWFTDQYNCSRFPDDTVHNMQTTVYIYRDADKSLARPTSRCILFDGENISFDASLVINT